MASYQSILRDLQSGKVAPVYFLHGEEPYFLDNLTGYMAENLLNDSEKDFNQTILYGKDAGMDYLKGLLTKYPVMASRQVVILKEAQDFKQLNDLVSYVKSPVKTTVFIICYKHKKVDKRTRFYRTIKENSVLFESKRVNEYKIPEWITSFLSNKGHNISPKAAHLLTEYLGNDLKKIVNELEKLFLDNRTGRKIDVGDIERNIGISKDYNIFELQRALGFKDAEKTTKILNYFRANPKANPIQMVVGVLFSYFSKLFALYYSRGPREKVSKELGIPCFVMKEHIQVAEKYNHRLNLVMEILQEYDLRSKGINDQNTGEGELLKELVFKILYT